MKLSIEIEDTDSRFAAVLAALCGQPTFVPAVSVTDTPKRRQTRAEAQAATLAAFEAMKAQDAAQVTVDTILTTAEAARDAEALAADLAKDEAKAIARQEADAAARNADIGAAEVAAGLPSIDASDTRSHDELLAAVRERSHESGALWLREIQAKYAVRSLSLLSDAQMREILA